MATATLKNAAAFDVDTLIASFDPKSATAEHLAKLAALMEAAKARIAEEEAAKKAAEDAAEAENMRPFIEAAWEKEAALRAEAEAAEKACQAAYAEAMSLTRQRDRLLGIETFGDDRKPGTKRPTLKGQVEDYLSAGGIPTTAQIAEGLHGKVFHENGQPKSIAELKSTISMRMKTFGYESKSGIWVKT